MKKLIALLCITTILLTFISCDFDANNSSNNSNKNSSDNSKQNKEKETEQILFWVSFETNGGTNIDSIQTLLLRSAPTTTKEDHVFVGWYLDEQLTQAAVFPMEITYSRTLYAKWLRTKKQLKCESTVLKNWEGDSPSTAYFITPSGFDMEELSKQGYQMTITIDYNVYYKKDYDVPFDIGYAGAPKYEIRVYNAQYKGYMDDNIKTSKSKTHKNFSFTQSVSDIKNSTWTLSFATENIQNKIYFSDITITYECHK